MLSAGQLLTHRIKQLGIAFHWAIAIQAGRSGFGDERRLYSLANPFRRPPAHHPLGEREAIGTAAHELADPWYHRGEHSGEARGRQRALGSGTKSQKKNRARDQVF